MHTAKCSIKCCSKNAVYGPHHTTNILCDIHRAKHTVDMRHAKCECCSRRPTYYVPGEAWSRCRFHAKPSMERIMLSEMYKVINGVCYEMPKVKYTKSLYLNRVTRVLDRKVSQMPNKLEAALLYYEEMEIICENAAKLKENKFVPYIPKQLK